MEDPSNPGTVVNSLDTPIAVRADIVNQLEILDLIQEEEENYGTQAFECDSNDNPIINPSAKHQGNKIRICVQPNNFTQQYGVVMKSINSFTLVRGDVSQQLIVPDSVIQDTQATTYTCIPGEMTCSLTSEISNSLFYSAGTVTGSGVAWLQYGTLNQIENDIEH